MSRTLLLGTCFILAGCIGGQNEDAARSQSQANLKKIKRAILKYELNCARKKGSARLPPWALYEELGSFSKAPATPPLLSWRVSILPELGYQKLFDQFHLKEPWDSAHNKTLLAQMPSEYKFPLIDDGGGMTRYQGFVSQESNTSFHPWRRRSTFNVTDGTMNTILIAEASKPVPWSKPADLPYEKDQPLPQLGGAFTGGYHVVTVNGEVWFVSQNAPEKDLRAAIVGSDNIVFDWQNLTK